jgi:hypothetical protein
MYTCAGSEATRGAGLSALSVRLKRCKIVLSFILWERYAARARANCQLTTIGDCVFGPKHTLLKQPHITDDPSQTIPIQPHKTPKISAQTMYETISLTSKGQNGRRRRSTAGQCHNLANVARIECGYGVTARVG